MTTPEPREHGFAALRGYAAIGDGRTVALVARDGRIDWLPVPRLDTPPMFAALLDDRRGGRIELAPIEPFTSTRGYVDGTNVLRTRFTTASGSVDVTDVLATGVAGRLPWMQLVRRVDGVAGSVGMAWRVAPGDVFGAGPVRRADAADVPLLASGTRTIALVGLAHGPADADGATEFTGAFTATPGSRHLICVTGTDDEPVRVPDPHIADESVDRTIADWQRWSKVFSWDGPWADVVHRSALALKLLIFAPSGAIAAAATTSLPESFAGGKNWDYRFAWIRDLSYSVDALLQFGLREEPHSSVAFMLRALKAQDGRMPIFLTLDGELADGVHHERARGWRGVRPVLTGNRAAGQLQLGTYADLLGLLAAYLQDGNAIDATSADLLVQLADDACTRWTKKDAGMWELTTPKHHVSSKMGCWQALDAAIALLDAGHLHPPRGTRERWEKNRRLIERWVAKHGWNERLGAYVMAKGSRKLDASVLLHAESGFDRGERMSRTIDAVRAELGDGPLLYRYSGMRGVEGTFTACAFWTVSALACVGRMDEATRLMDQLVEQVNDVGMMSEMIDARDGAFLGNLPQALSHLALVNAASVIQRLRNDPDASRFGGM